MILNVNIYFKIRRCEAAGSILLIENFSGYIVLYLFFA